MIRLYLNSQLISRSFKILEIANFIIESEQGNFDITKNLNPMNPSDFCRLLLKECDDFKIYIKVEVKLNKTPEFYATLQDI